jgi:hypothetical protein
MPASLPAVGDTPEFRLARLTLRRPLREADLAAVRLATEAGLNWDAVVEGAERHGIAAPLLAALKASGSAVPESATARLRSRAHESVARSLGHVAELARLAPLLDDAGVRRLVLKGVALSVQLYGDASLRSPRDIDLLVDPARFGEAEAVLEAAGYRRCVPAMSARQGEAYRRWIRDIAWVNAEAGVMVELHIRLTDDAALIPQDFEMLWREREAVRIGGAEVDALARTRLALYLCAHGAGHAWERLSWLVDLSGALPDAAAVEAAHAAAEAAGLDAAMRHGLLLAHDWLDAPLEAALLARARTDRRVRRLHRILAHGYDGERWRQSPPVGTGPAFWRYSVWQRLYRLSLKSGWQYRAHQVARELFSPADWTTVRLPDRLFWLYPAVRPFGWLARRRRGAA